MCPGHAGGGSPLAPELLDKQQDNGSLCLASLRPFTVYAARNIVAHNAGKVTYGDLDDLSTSICMQCSSGSKMISHLLTPRFAFHTGDSQPSSSPLAANA